MENSEAAPSVGRPRDRRLDALGDLRVLPDERGMFDPALTSAWNTLFCGQKRGILSSWDNTFRCNGSCKRRRWRCQHRGSILTADFYPLLADEDKPIECTQLPGETIFVPSGW